MHNSSDSLTWTRAADLILGHPSGHRTGTYFLYIGYPHTSLLLTFAVEANLESIYIFPQKELLTFSQIKCLAPGQFYFEPFLGLELWLGVFALHITSILVSTANVEVMTCDSFSGVPLKMLKGKCVTRWPSEVSKRSIQRGNLYQQAGLSEREGRNVCHDPIWARGFADILFSLAPTGLTGEYYHPHFASMETESERDKETWTCSRWGLSRDVLPLQFVLLPPHHAGFLAGLSNASCPKDIVIRDENLGSGALVLVPQFHLILVGAAGKIRQGVGKVCWGAGNRASRFCPTPSVPLAFSIWSRCSLGTLSLDLTFSKKFRQKTGRSLVLSIIPGLK